MTYLQLCAEDHRWWWKSFWNLRRAGLYLFCIRLWFLASQIGFGGILAGGGVLDVHEHDFDLLWTLLWCRGILEFGVVY